MFFLVPVCPQALSTAVLNPDWPRFSPDAGGPKERWWMPAISENAATIFSLCILVDEATAVQDGGLFQKQTLQNMHQKKASHGCCSCNCCFFPPLSVLHQSGFIYLLFSFTRSVLVESFMVLLNNIHQDFKFKCTSSFQHGPALSTQTHRLPVALCTHWLLWFHCTHSGLLRLAVSSSLNSSRTGWSKCPLTNVSLLKTEMLTTGEFITGCRGSLREKRRQNV